MKTHKISWLNIPGYKGETWNPIIGCSKISEGCKNCYAEKQAFRCYHMMKHKTDTYSFVLANNGKNPDQFKYIPKWNGKTHLVKEALDKPLHWKKPRAIFVCSMGDLFHESIPFEWIDKVFQVMHQCNQHKFIILTKRPSRAIDYIKWVCKRAHLSIEDLVPAPDSNYIWGVTAENQKQANERIPALLSIPAAKRFVSIEPILGSVNLTSNFDGASDHNYLKGTLFCAGQNEPTYTSKLDWVIVGGESGHHARPMHPDWVRSILYQCKKSNVPFFFKQWGEWSSDNTCKNGKLQNSISMDINGIQGTKEVDFDAWRARSFENFFKVGRKVSGHLLDSKEYLNFPKL